ncbi:MAG: hydroxyacid dehydrogenase, partial [Bacteroidetes bacterium HGW-Bacteroidetes-10]
GELVLWSHSFPEDIAERVKEADVVIVNKVRMFAEQIDSAPNLRLICVAATGTNNVDIPYANSKGIQVKNVVGYSTDSVAQITFGSLLALMNHSAYFDNCVKSGEYSKSLHFTDTGRSFTEIAGKRFGIIGMGTIGKRVAAIATAFGAKVSYYSTGGSAHCSDYPSVSLNELLSESDIISIHAPLSDKTNNLISLEQLKMMKQSGIIMNMGRGGIINEADLAIALDSGIIAGAATDVFVQEPVPADHPYLKVKNRERLILTPHIGWAGENAKNVLIKGIAENIKSALKLL